MKRRSLALGLILLFTVIGMCVLPSTRGSILLAQVAYAASTIKSIHMVDHYFKTDENGNRIECNRVEYWIKLPSKSLMRSQAGDEVSDDGSTHVTVKTSNGVTIATMSPSLGRLAFRGSTAGDMGFFDYTVLLRSLVQRQIRVSSEQETTLPNGRPGMTLELGGNQPARITIDRTTNRIARVEQFQDIDGKLVTIGILDVIEYDKEMSDSMFRPEIPGDAAVVDTRKGTVASSESEERREAKAEELKSSGAQLLEDVGEQYVTPDTMFGSQGIIFRPLETGTFRVFYIPSRKSLYVLGKCIVTDEKTPGFQLVVQDGEFILPREVEFTHHPEAYNLPNPKDHFNKAGFNYEAWHRNHLEVDKRVAKLLSHKSAKGHPVYQGAEIERLQGNSWSTSQFRLSAEDGSTDRLFAVPGKHLFICVGEVHVKRLGMPDEICKNGTISWDGKILSSE